MKENKLKTGWISFFYNSQNELLVHGSDMRPAIYDTEEKAKLSASQWGKEGVVVKIRYKNDTEVM